VIGSIVFSIFAQNNALMIKFRSTLIILLSVTLLYSCRTIKPVVAPRSGTEPAQQYIDQYRNLAISEMRRTGVPASITLAQGMIESDFGRSSLATEANNHFGIKCHNDWTGPTIRHHDDKRNECFRKYRKAEESFSDHSDFLRSGSRYTALFDLAPDDYKAWARGLKKAGYATNPDYANMLIAKIEQYGLSDLDKGGNNNRNSQIARVEVDSSLPVNAQSGTKTDTRIQEMPAGTVNISRIMEVNRVQYIIVREGETRDKIEKEFNLLRWELPKYNELGSDFSLYAGQRLYLQPKREKAEPGKDTYITVSGDSMYSISQVFGVKVKSLFEYNRMAEGTEPDPGQKIWLRGMKPVN